MLVVSQYPSYFECQNENCTKCKNQIVCVTQCLEDFSNGVKHKKNKKELKIIIEDYLLKELEK